jgi:leader peptidase (prepilin peptidase)/N-methyltransferase
MIAVDPVIGVYAGAAAVLGVAVAVALRTRRYRRDDDAIHRTLPLATVPVAAVIGTVLAGPFFVGRPLLVIGTYLLALTWAIALAYIDFDVRRLPDRIVLPGYVVAGGLLTGCSAVTGRWSALLWAAVCAGAAVALFFLAALLSPGADGLGFGDVKLSGVLAGLLGWVGVLNAVMGLLTGFIIGGVVAAALLIARRVDRRSHISFGPAMIVGAYLWCLLPPA